MRNKNGMSDRIQQAKTFVTGLVLGSAIGAGAALLNAPQSGKKTRKQIQKKAAEVQNMAEEKVEGVRDRIQGTSQQVAEAAEATQARVKEAAGDRLGQLQDEFKV